MEKGHVMGYVDMRPAKMKPAMKEPRLAPERLGFTDRGSAPDKASEHLTEMMASADGHSIGTRPKAEFCTKTPAASCLSRI